MNELMLEKAREVIHYGFDLLDESIECWQNSLPITAEAGILKQYIQSRLNVHVRFRTETLEGEAGGKDYLVIFFFLNEFVRVQFPGNVFGSDGQSEWDVWRNDKNESMFVDVIEFRENVKGIIHRVRCPSLVRLIRCDVGLEELEEFKTLGRLCGLVSDPDWERGLPVWLTRRTRKHKLPSEVIERSPEIMNEIADHQRELWGGWCDSSNKKGPLPFGVFCDGVTCNLVLRNCVPLSNQIFNVSEITLRTFDFSIDSI